MHTQSKDYAVGMHPITCTNRNIPTLYYLLHTCQRRDSFFNGHGEGRTKVTQGLYPSPVVIQYALSLVIKRHKMRGVPVRPLLMFVSLLRRIVLSDLPRNVFHQA